MAGIKKPPHLHKTKGLTVMMRPDQYELMQKIALHEGEFMSVWGLKVFEQYCQQYRQQNPDMEAELEALAS